MRNFIFRCVGVEGHKSPVSSTSYKFGLQMAPSVEALQNEGTHGHLYAGNTEGQPFTGESEFSLASSTAEGNCDLANNRCMCGCPGQLKKNL